MTTTAKARLKRLGLHPGQIEPYRSRKRFKTVVAGRRWGKTELAMLMLLTGGGDGRGCLTSPGLYRYIGPTIKLARKTLWRRKLKRALDPSWLAKPMHESHLEVHFRNGSILEVMGAEEEGALRGEGVKGVVLDEYADMRPAAWSEEVRPSLMDERGWALFIGSPQSFNHFHELWIRGYSEKYANWASWQFKSIDNPLLDPEDIEEARSTTDPRTFRQEYEASFEAMAGRIYYDFDRTRDVRSVALQPGLAVCVSFDFNVNPAVAVIGQRYQDECRVWREVFVTHAGGEATRASATKARDLIREAGWKGEIKLYADATGTNPKTTGPADHAVVREIFPLASWHVPKANSHVKDRYAAVNGRICSADGVRHTTIDPSCVHLVADLEQVVFDDSGVADQKSNPMLTHISDAFGYWVHREWPPVRKTMAGAFHMEHLV